MAYANRHDVASELLFVDAVPKATATAGGTGDATLVHGTAIDVTALLTPAGGDGGVAVGLCRYESVAFAIAATVTVAATQGIAVTASIETSAVSNFASSTTLVATKNVISFTSTPGGTFGLVGKIGCSLENALQFVRVSLTPDLSAGSIDVSDIQALALFGGPGELP